MNKCNKVEQDISTLIARSLTGRITDDERAKLALWLSESIENARQYKLFCDAKDLVSQYRIYASVDEKRAWHRFRHRYIKGTGRQAVMRLLRYAAVIVAFVCVFVTCKVYLFGTPAITDKATLAAMRRSAETGKQKALLTLPDGKSTILSTPTEADRESLVTKIIRSMTDDSAARNNKLTTYPDSEYWITLSDGTLVHLNGGTTLVYPERFSGQDRTVCLEGEAYFEVAHNKDAPFRILTAHGTVTDYGTAFNVNTRINNGTEVVLVEGSVGVKPKHGRETMLKPGQLAYFGKRQTEAEVDDVDVSTFVSWNKGNFTFNDCPLDELMDVVSHWYGIDIRYDSEDIRQLRFTGNINRYDSSRPVLRAIETAIGSVNIEKDGGGYILRRK